MDSSLVFNVWEERFTQWNIADCVILNILELLRPFLTKQKGVTRQQKVKRQGMR